MATSNSPYRDIAEIYRAGNAWQAEKDEEKRKTIQANAQQYYKNLINSGYADIANELSVSDSKRRKEIMDKWAAITDTTTGTLKTGVNNPAYNQGISAAMSKNNEYFDTIKKDHADMSGKYNDIYKYANSDITQTDEYKSTFNNVMPQYTLDAQKGRNNTMASGAAANGGNIDSFSEANAMRQQAALTAKGQALAHQMGLDAYNARIQGVRGILSDMGIDNGRTYTAMSDSINIDRQTANDVFNNEQTAINNGIDNKAKIAAVTGYTPDEWIVSNNPYMNDNGTIKDEYKDNDFAAIMANAKAKGNTEAYNAAATARFYKIMGDYAKYGQYDDGAYNIPGPKRTEEAREFDEQIKQADRALGAESSMNAANNQAKLSLADKEAAAALNLANVNNTSAEKIAAMKAQEPTLTLAQATTALKNGELNDTILAVYNAANGTEYTMDNPPPVYKVPQNVNDGSLLGNKEDDEEWNIFLEKFPTDTNSNNSKIVEFLNKRLKPYYDNGREINEEVIENLIVGTDVKNSSSTEYDIDVEDAIAICNALGLDSAWTDKYKNRWGFNSGKGMKHAK